MESEQQLTDSLYQEEMSDVPFSEEQKIEPKEGESIEQPQEEVKGESQGQQESDQSEETRLSTKKFITKLQRDRLRAVHEAQELRERVGQLEDLTGYMNEGVLKQYEVNAQLMLEKARLSKRQAVELADTDALIQADEDISRAVAQMEYLKTLPAPRAKAETSTQKPQQQEYEPDPSIEHWLGRNTWCDERTPHYDPDKAADVLAYAAGLDASLSRQGRTEEYYTPQYFAKIDNYAKLYDQQYSPKASFMKAPISPVASVRSSSSASVPSKAREQIKLTEADKEMARLLKVKEEDYVKFKIADIKKQQEKGQRYGYGY